MTSDLAGLGVLADENLAQSWSTFGRSSGASLGRSDRCSFVATGVPMAFFSGAFAAGPVTDCEAVVDDAIIFMAEHDVPFLLWVREGVDDELLDAGRRAGLRDSSGPPAMVLPSIPPSPPPPPELEFTVVADVEGVAVCRDVVHRGLEIPSEIADTLFLDEIVDPDPITTVVGSVGDTPVASASVVVTGTTARIYNVATRPSTGEGGTARTQDPRRARPTSHGDALGGGPPDDTRTQSSTTAPAESCSRGVTGQNRPAGLRNCDDERIDSGTGSGLSPQLGCSLGSPLVDRRFDDAHLQESVGIGVARWVTL